MTGSEERDVPLGELEPEARELKIAQAIATSWRAAGAPDLPAEASARIRERLLAEATRSVVETPSSASSVRVTPLRVAAVALPLAAAAAITLVIIAPWSGPQTEGRPILTSPQANAPAPQRDGWREPQGASETEVGEILAPADGSPAEIDIPDLGRLVLLERAVARLDAQGDHVELVLERGAVVASVEKRERNRAFFVTTEAGRVEIVGTVFSVAIEEDGVRVAVAEGRVRVESPLSDKGGAEVGTGEELALSRASLETRQMSREARSRIDAALGIEHSASTAAKKDSAPAADFDAQFVEAEKLMKAGRDMDALAVYRSIMRGTDGDLKSDAAFAVGQIQYRSGDASACVRAFTEGMPLFVGTPYEVGAKSYLDKCRARLDEGR
jgi:hypothetical protein